MNRLNNNEYKSLFESVQRMNEMPWDGPNMRPIPGPHGRPIFPTPMAPVEPVEPVEPDEPDEPTYPGDIDIAPNIKDALPWWIPEDKIPSPLIVPPITEEEIKELLDSGILDELPHFGPFGVTPNVVRKILEEIIEENEPPLHPNLLDLLKRALEMLRERL